MLPWLLLVAGPAAADDGQALQLVTLREGVDFAIPATLEHAPELKFQPRFQLKPIRVFSDATSDPLQLYILRGPARASAGLPRNSHRVTKAYARGFAEGLRSAMALLEVREVRPGRYDETRGTFSVRFNARSPARARDLLGKLSARKGAGTRATRRACYLTQLLGEDTAVSASRLQARYAETARRCGGSRGAVGAYVRKLGVDAFTPRETAFVSIAFFTRSALLVSLMVAPIARAPEAETVGEMIWKSATVQPEARLQLAATKPADAAGASRRAIRAGAILAYLLGLLVVGALLAFGLARLGLRAGAAAATGLGAGLAVATAAVVLAQGLTAATSAQLVAQLFTVTLAFRPLQRRLARPPPAPVSTEPKTA